MTISTAQEQNSASDGIEKVWLQNEAGLRVAILSIGASLQAIELPTQFGPVNAILGYTGSGPYKENPYYLGATVGRFANRIENASFKLTGTNHQLSRNPESSPHCLHGGRTGFSHRDWRVAGVENEHSLTLHLDSAHGDQGFPSNLQASVKYSLLDGWKLQIDYRAVTDRPTVVNLTNHAYFNLNSDRSPADNHVVFIDADEFIPIDLSLIPTGGMNPVSGSVFDFRRPGPIGEGLRTPNCQVQIAGGYDHSYVLNTPGNKTSPSARLWSPQSGLSVEIQTTQPALQFYTGQHLGEPFNPHDGICLEAQQLPNAPNIPTFPSTVLLPGEIYQHRTLYEFKQS